MADFPPKKQSKMIHRLPGFHRIAQLALHILGVYIHRFKQPETENNKKKIPEISKKAKFGFAAHRHLYCICIYIHKICIALGIISNLEMS